MSYSDRVFNVLYSAHSNKHGSNEDTLPNDQHGDRANIHGIMMTVSWLMLATISILTASLMKDILTKKVGRYQLWFVIHVGLNLLLTLLTVVGLLMIFSARGWKLIDHNTGHVVLGILITTFMTVNMLLGRFRPEKYSKYRKVFNFVHFFVGMSAYGMAIAAMMLGYYAMRSTVEYDHTSSGWQDYLIILICVPTFSTVFLSFVLRFLGSEKSDQSDSSDSSDGFTCLQKFKITLYCMLSIPAFFVGLVIVAQPVIGL